MRTVETTEKVRVNEACVNRGSTVNDRQKKYDEDISFSVFYFIWQFEARMVATLFPRPLLFLLPKALGGGKRRDTVNEVGKAAIEF